MVVMLNLDLLRCQKAADGEQVDSVKPTTTNFVTLSGLSHGPLVLDYVHSRG